MIRDAFGLLALSGALVAGACGGGSSGAKLAASDLDAAFHTAVCTRATTCGLFPDEATCERAYTSISFPLSTSDFAAIDAGKVTYDGAAAKTCVDAHAKQSCDSTVEGSRSLPTACDHIVAGKLGDGAACVLNSECKSQVCSIPICAVACCAGTCMGATAPVRGKLGAACTNLPCEDGAFCDISMGPTGTCVAFYKEGAACALDLQCDYGLGCIGTPMQCHPVPTASEPCPDGRCRDEGTVCNAAGTCEAVALPAAACDTDLDCSHYYHCDASKHCAEGSGPNGPCTSSTDCFDDGTFCSIPSGQSMGTCAPAQADQAACTDDRDCLSDHCEDSATNPVCTDSPICT